MKCDKCGNEYFTGTVCPNCGTPAAMDSDSPTVALDQMPETSAPVEHVQAPYGGQESNIQNSYPGQENNIQNPYPGQENNIQNPYNGQQYNNMYGNQQNNVYGAQPNNMYGGQANNLYGGQPNNMYGGQPNNMYGNPQNNMYGGQNGFNPGNPNYNMTPEEPKKSKAPIIVAVSCVFVAIVAIVLILVFVVFKKDDEADTENTRYTTEERTSEDATEPPTSVDDTEEATKEESSTSAPISSGALDGTVVYDDDVLQITVISADYTDDMLEITGQVQNKTDGELRLSSECVAVDNISIASYLSTTVSENDKEDWSLYLFNEDLEPAGIQSFTELLVYFIAYDASSYETLCRGDFSYSCNVKTGVTPKYDENRFDDLFEDENCSVSVYKDIVYDDYRDAYFSVLRIENKLDVPVSIMLDNTYINGVLVDEYGGWEDVVPHTVVYEEVYWYTEDLTPDSMSFETIEMGFDLFDYDTWDDYTLENISYSIEKVVK